MNKRIKEKENGLFLAITSQTKGRVDMVKNYTVNTATVWLLKVDPELFVA